MDDFTESEFETKKQRLVHALSVGCIPHEHPHAYLIVGQPGAGKTTMANIFKRTEHEDAIFISGDDYRKEHPHFKELQEQYGDDSVQHTKEFAGRMTEALIDALSQQGYHLIIEGTLRTVEVPLKTKKLLEHRGYQVSLNVMLVRPEVSYLSTLKRYAQMKAHGGTPRKTPKEHHDAVAKSIVENLSALYLMDAFSEIRMFTREETCIYDMQKTPRENPAHLMEAEFFRKLTSAEKQEIRDEYLPYVENAAQLDQILDDYAAIFQSPKERGQER